MLRTSLTLLTLSTLPLLALAAGDNTTGHHMMPQSAHAMGNMHHGSTGMHGTHMQHSEHMAQTSGHHHEQLHAYGKPGDPAKVDRTIEMSMDDTMRFTPSNIDIQAGEIIRFAIKNTGQLPHEMVMGSLAELKAHAQEMLAMPDMEHHDEPNMLSLEPGQSGELIWHFDKAITVDFACLIPGHTEAGMTGKIHVK
ncbi:cupredoxin family protein [Denitrificimonas sp. JX-1]|uniref:Cupredoxin family protein n=1 Tax=Denitrificimonas halotolerans TaxID=3098930 RepID=A0ABU5GTJ7_9GAMM|nr:cupredoxin family protein [Denitrificimonas sp. JX-1]MDY7220312.1 cupredoxin family protein [Denitrificimonas sp. JX-1]